MSAPVDVLAHLEGMGLRYGDKWKAAHDALAELIAAAKLVNAGHTAPHDCYATGPMTGDPFLDLVRCPGCQLAEALARVGGAK